MFFSPIKREGGGVCGENLELSHQTAPLMSMVNYINAGLEKVKSHQIQFAYRSVKRQKHCFIPL
jgi:hypothetical protein